MDALIRIKTLVVRGQLRFTGKAREEMNRDGLGRIEVVESLLNAQSIQKVLRSRSSQRRFAGERLYVIKSFSYSGTLIYTKGVIVHEETQDTFYVLVSAKNSLD